MYLSNYLSEFPVEFPCNHCISLMTLILDCFFPHAFTSFRGQRLRGETWLFRCKKTAVDRASVPVSVLWKESILSII